MKVKCTSHTVSCIKHKHYVVKWTIIGQMAIAITLRGFNDLKRSMTPIFFRWVIFSTNFLSFAKKWRKSIKEKFEFFASRSIRFHSFGPVCLVVQQFQMPLQFLRFVKMMAIFEIINAIDSLTQNIVRIVCLHWFIFDILAQKSWSPCWITCTNLSKSD